MRWDKTIVFVVPAAIAIAGCEDRAKPAYQNCLIAAAKNALLEAESDCVAAISADSNSVSGKAAAQKLKDMQPEITQAKAEKAKADETARQAAKQAEAARMQHLRLRVSKKYWDESPDSLCTGKGLPPYRWSYEGGTFAEDHTMAFADGCQSPWERQDVTDFCCPQRPRTLGF